MPPFSQYSSFVNDSEIKEDNKFDVENSKPMANSRFLTPNVDDGNKQIVAKVENSERSLDRPSQKIINASLVLGWSGEPEEEGFECCDCVIVLSRSVNDDVDDTAKEGQNILQEEVSVVHEEENSNSKEENGNSVEVSDNKEEENFDSKEQNLNRAEENAGSEGEENSTNKEENANSAGENAGSVGGKSAEDEHVSNTQLQTATESTNYGCTLDGKLAQQQEKQSINLKELPKKSGYVKKLRKRLFSFRWGRKKNQAKDNSAMSLTISENADVDSIAFASDEDFRKCNGLSEVTRLDDIDGSGITQTSVQPKQLEELQKPQFQFEDDISLEGKKFSECKTESESESESATSSENLSLSHFDDTRKIQQSHLEEQSLCRDIQPSTSILPFLVRFKIKKKVHTAACSRVTKDEEEGVECVLPQIQLFLDQLSSKSNSSWADTQYHAYLDSTFVSNVDESKKDVSGEDYDIDVNDTNVDYESLGAAISISFEDDPWCAAKRGDLRALLQFAKQEPPIDWTMNDEFNGTPLYYACRSGAVVGKNGLSTVRLLLELWPGPIPKDDFDRCHKNAINCDVRKLLNEFRNFDQSKDLNAIIDAFVQDCMEEEEKKDDDDDDFIYDDDDGDY